MPTSAQPPHSGGCSFLPQNTRIILEKYSKCHRRDKSVSDHTLTLGDQGAEAAFNFLFYGIYVDLGTGNGYRHDNGGDLEILDPEYRHKHKMGKMRERKPWFNTPWYISKEVMKSKMASMMGEAFVGLLDTLDGRHRK